MSRKFTLSLLTCSMIMALMLLGLHIQPVRAQDSTPTATAAADDSDTDSRIEVSGTVVSVTPVNDSVSIVTLDDGTELKVNPASAGADLLTEGASVTIVASLDDDGEELVVKTVTLDEEATPEPTDVATDVPTETPTEVATDVPTEEPTQVATETATCGGNNAHPVATRLADAFGVSYDEIMAWHCQGMGFGNIAKAYKMAELLKDKGGLTAADYLNMKLSGQGWGQIMKDAKVSPSELAMGQVIKGNKHSTDGTTTNGKGKGKGNKGKGGKGNGKGGK